MSGKRLRVSIGAGALVLLATALALAGGTNVMRSSPGASIAKFRADPELALGKENAQTLVGNRGEGERSFAEEQYAERAYPADEIPLEATLNAQREWAAIASSGKKNDAGQWSLAGPSSAKYPGVL